MNEARNGDWSALDAYLRDIHSQPTLTEDQLNETTARSSKGDAAAQELLVRSHLRLVASIAHQYGCYGLPLADVIAEGNIALIRAAELYDPKFGTKFATYAAVWVKQRIHRALTAGAKVVRIPVWRSQRLRKVARLNEELSQQLGRTATEEELAARLGLNEREMAELQGERLSVSSLDAPLDASDSESNNVLALMEDESTPDAFTTVAENETRNELIAALHDLDDRELDVVSAKFGLHREAVSFRDIGKRLGFSHEWARRVAESALAKIRRAMKAAGKFTDKERALRRLRVLERLTAVTTPGSVRKQMATAG